MTWTWTVETGTVVLRPSTPLPGVGDVGFAGRALRPDAVDPLRERARVRLDQVHGRSVETVDGPGTIPACDAAVTAVRGLVLTVRTADCLPVLLADGDRLALVHAGWRGLDAGILEAAVARFPRRDRVAALLGPAIGPCCFEVGEEVAARFAASVLRPPGRRRPHVDLFTEARSRLHGAGLAGAADLPAGPCTRCHQHLLHSHRGSGGAPGRITAWAVLDGAAQHAS